MKFLSRIEEQQQICKKYNANYSESLLNLKVGISLNVREGILPINGLRHLPEGNSTGWYIWAGDYSSDIDFFHPLHIKHIESWSPLIEKFLGLEPGYRFLVTPDYEDVWQDLSLLPIWS